MTGRNATPASQSRIFRFLNPLMRFVLRHSPLRPRRGRLLLLSFNGRTSGRPYTIPVSYVVDADGSLLVPGGGGWKANLGGGRRAQLRLDGRDVGATTELISDASEVARLLPRLASASSFIDRYIGVPIDADGRPDPASLARALTDGFAIVRLRLVD